MPGDHRSGAGRLRPVSNGGSPIKVACVIALGSAFFVRRAAAVLAAGACLIGAPALANSSASADIAAPLRAAQAARQTGLGGGDSEFQQLFSSWRSMDHGSLMAPHAAVSIPSLMPVDNPRFTSGFGLRWHPVLGGRREHKGIDLADPVGTPVHAAADGVIGRADWFSSYGLFVEIEHGGEIETRYGHMSRLNVAAGQFVHKGDVIGYIGTTGRSTGPHLHYEVRVEGVAVNPLPYMQGTGNIELARAGAAAGAGDTTADSGDD
ncbi:MAG: M23 family metallopeptidase [Sphingomonadales bacterium]|nr:M23 family metallopeptidase [Sphingomonadales bacterium]